MTVDALSENEKFQLMCEQASKFYSSSSFVLIEKIVTEQEHLEGLSPETKTKYWLAMDIVLGNIRYGKNGWERAT